MKSGYQISSRVCLRKALRQCSAGLASTIRQFDDPIQTGDGGELRTLRDAGVFTPTPALHPYTASAAPWHLMHEGVPTFPKMPPFPGN
jgi:hypothetical protein